MSEKLPEGWVETELDNVCTKPQYGWTTKSSKTGKVKLLRTTDISNPPVNWNKVPYCAIAPDNLEKYIIHENDILVSRAGSIGISYLISKDELKHNAVFASYLIRFEPLINPDYIGYYFKSDKYWEYISGYKSGIAIPNINATKLRNLILPLPPLAEQKRIADKLDEILPRIEKLKDRLEKVRKLIKQFRESVLDNAVTGKLTEEWRKSNIDKIVIKQNIFSLKKIEIKSNNKSLKTELELPSIPDEWVWINLDDTGIMGRGRSKHRPRNAEFLYGGDYPFIQTGDISNANRKIYSHKQTYNQEGLSQSKLWPQNTVCITIAANIAESAILTYPACFPDSVVGIIPNENICKSELIQFYIETIRQNLSDYAPATAQKNINLGILREIKFPLPSIEEQVEIVNQVEKLDSVANKINTRIELIFNQISILKDEILSKAFKGELVPTEAELASKEGRNYESGSELLERIKSEKKKRVKSEHTKRRMVVEPGHIKLSEYFKISGEVISMGKKLNLKEIIRKNPEGITPEELFTESNYEVDKIDKFYKELKSISNEINEVKAEANSKEWPKILLKPKEG